MPKSKSGSVDGDSAPQILLSMKNDVFKSIVYRHFRTLGTKSNRVVEGLVVARIFEDLTRHEGDVDGDKCVFYKAKGDKQVFLSREKALGFIRETIKNRNKTSHLWLEDASQSATIEDEKAEEATNSNALGKGNNDNEGTETENSLSASKPAAAPAAAEAQSVSEADNQQQNFTKDPAIAQDNQSLAAAEAQLASEADNQQKNSTEDPAIAQDHQSPAAAEAQSVSEADNQQQNPTEDPAIAQDNQLDENATKLAHDESDEDDVTLAAIAASKRKRKSPRIPKQKSSYEEDDSSHIDDVEEDAGNEVGDNDQENVDGTNSQSANIQLSMLDPYYRQTMFHYYENRKGSSRTQRANEIYAKFRNKLEQTGGGFYKTERRGGNWYLVESEKDILKKIKSDLGKKDRYEKEMASTIVLDLVIDAKYAKIMHKHYNILGLEDGEAQEREEARKVLVELKQSYSSFVIIEGGDRVEVDQEDEDVLLEVILKNIQRREDSKMWFDEQASLSLHMSSAASAAPTEQTSTTYKKRRPNAAKDQNSATSRKRGPNAFSDQNRTTSKKRRATTSPQYNQRLTKNKEQPKQSRSETKPKRIPTDQPSSHSSIFSPLNDRLPPRKMLTVSSRTPIETVSQLVQIIQLATHKLNDLFGSTRRHCKVLRLNHLAELGGTMTGIPTLAELAKSMAISRSNILKWCEMCQSAERKGFDFLRYGNDSIDSHSGTFDVGVEDSDVFVVKRCGEMVIAHFFDGVARVALRETENGDSGDTEKTKNCDALQDSVDKVGGNMDADTAEMDKSHHDDIPLHELDGSGGEVPSAVKEESGTTRSDPKQDDHVLDEFNQSDENLVISVDKVPAAAAAAVADEQGEVRERTAEDDATLKQTKFNQTTDNDDTISPADGGSDDVLQNSDARQTGWDKNDNYDTINSADGDNVLQNSVDGSSYDIDSVLRNADLSNENGGSQDFNDPQHSSHDIEVHETAAEPSSSETKEFDAECAILEEVQEPDTEMMECSSQVAQSSPKPACDDATLSEHAVEEVVAERESEDTKMAECSSQLSANILNHQEHEFLNAPIADHTNDEVVAGQDCKETEQTNHPSSDSVEPPLDVIPSDDATSQQSAPDPEVLQHQHKPSEEDVNASFNEMKCSIAQISDAIGAKTELPTDDKVIMTREQPRAVDLQSDPSSHLNGTTNGDSVHHSTKLIALQQDDTLNEKSEVANDVEVTSDKVEEKLIHATGAKLGNVAVMKINDALPKVSTKQSVEDVKDSFMEINDAQQQINENKSADDTDTKSEVANDVEVTSDKVGEKLIHATGAKLGNVSVMEINDALPKVSTRQSVEDANPTLKVAEDSFMEINDAQQQINENKSADNTDMSTTNPDEQHDKKFDHFLSEIKKGSRIVVKWGKTGDLYRATVKKILTNRDKPTLKVHYDGKKGHIVDTITLDMVEGFIEEEKRGSEQDTPSPVHEARKSEPMEASNVSIKELLRGRYQNSLPDGKLEHREQCPELGPGWTVYVVARRNQAELGTRAGRYFISPSGKSFRSIPVLEKHFMQHPEEFDLCSSYHEIGDGDQGVSKYDEDGNGALHDEAEAVPDVAVDKNNQAFEDQASDSQPKTDVVVTDDMALLEVNNGKEVSNDVMELMTSTPSRGGTDKSLPQCQGNDDQTHSSVENTTSYSPLMIGHSAQGIEESHSDHEFLSSLLDERGLLFGDDVMEDDSSCCTSQQPSNSHGADTQPLEACTLRPLTSCDKSPPPDSEVQEDDFSFSLPKKVVHFAEDHQGPCQQDANEEQSGHSQQKVSEEQSDPSQQEATEEQSGHSQQEATSFCLSCKKKGLSLRMKRNKKSLVGGIVPVFAMETPADAEFAGYLGDGMLTDDDDSDQQSDEERPPIYRHQHCHMDGMLHQKAVSQYSPKLSPITVQNPNKTSAFVRISPILLYRSKDGIESKEPNDLHAGPLKLQNVVNQIERESSKDNVGEVEVQIQGKATHHKRAKPVNGEVLPSGTKSSSSPNEVVVINMKPTHSAFVSVPRARRPGVAPPVFPPSSSPLRINTLPDQSVPGKVQLFAFTYDDEKKDESNKRPKRKLKSTARFEPDMPDAQTNVKTGHGFLCPRCKSICDYDSKVCVGCDLECYYEAGVGVVVLKERASVAANPLSSKPAASSSTHARPEGVLCNCTYCDKHHFSIQGIYAHHGRAHPYLGKLDWTKVTFSCPFCKTSQAFTLGEVEKHVRENHPGSELVTPNTVKPQRNRSRNRGTMSPPQVSLNAAHDTRGTRTKHSSISSDTKHDADPSQVTPKWTKLDHRILLTDCKKDYPREISSIIDLVEDQCKAQEEVIEAAREQRVKLCKAEAEMEAKAWDEDRLAYQRGIRERSRYADAERIEKQRFTESQKLVIMQYEYENRNRKRTRNEIETEKLCSKPILFSGGKGRNLPLEKNVCKYDQCELCKVDTAYLQAVMLDTELASLKNNQPTSQNLLPPVSVLNPSFQVIPGDYFANAERDFGDETEATKANGGKSEGARKANLSRRDVATSKRLKIEEDKLFDMKKKQFSLQFVSAYNEGLIRDAWKNEPKNERRKTR